MAEDTTLDGDSSNQAPTSVAPEAECRKHLATLFITRVLTPLLATKRVRVEGEIIISLPLNPFQFY